MLLGDSFAVVDGERVQDRLPAVDLSGQVLSVRPSRYGGQVQHFQRGLLVGEMAPCSNGTTDACVQALDSVGIGYDRWRRFRRFAARVSFLGSGFGVFRRNRQGRPLLFDEL
jgi:hypothetical protein